VELRCQAWINATISPVVRSREILEEDSLHAKVVQHGINLGTAGITGVSILLPRGVLLELLLSLGDPQRVGSKSYELCVWSGMHTTTHA